MTMIAAGMYIRTLRTAQGFSRADVAALTGTHESQVQRIENGEQETRSSLMVRIVRVVGGDIGQVATLLLDECATAEDGQRYAEAWQQRIYDRAAQEAARSTDEELDTEIARLSALLMRLRSRPALIERLIGYAQALADDGDVGQKKPPIGSRRRRKRLS
jgi:transcriptional regulator with XRE-family HTH domain